MNCRFVLRTASTDDAPLLRRVFTDSHCAGWELLGLDEAGYLQLVEIQLAARQSEYRSAFPGSCEQIIAVAGVAGVAVGSCWLAETAEELRVVDIAVLAEHRRNGVARTVLGQVGADAASRGKPVRLSVWQENTVAQALVPRTRFSPARSRAGARWRSPGIPRAGMVRGHAPGNDADRSQCLSASWYSRTSTPG